jgi:serine/threonine-protein kinase RsbW
MKNNITIKSNMDNLRIVEKFIDDAATKYNFSDEIYGNIMIATMEAANNAIQHGNKSNPEKSVEIKLRKHGSDLQFIVSDQGSGFDFSKIPDPTAPENIEKISGRGIFLMEKLSDKIVFLESGRIVKLTFRLK